MTVFWLSLVMALAGCTGLVLAGKGMWQGWAIGLAVQPVWAVFAFVTKGYGLLITCVMYGFVYAKNLIKWRREKKSVKPYEEVINAGIMTRDQVIAVNKKIDNPSPKPEFKKNRFPFWCDTHRRPYSVCQDFSAFNVDRVNIELCETRDL